MTYRYISDIGAQGLKPLFVAGCCVTTIFLDLSFAAERYLRHTGRLARNTSAVDKSLSALSSKPGRNHCRARDRTDHFSHLCYRWYCWTHSTFNFRHPTASPPPRWISSVVHVWRSARYHWAQQLTLHQGRLRDKCHLRLRRIPATWRPVSSTPRAEGVFLG